MRDLYRLLLLLLFTKNTSINSLTFFQKKASHSLCRHSSLSASKKASHSLSRRSVLSASKKACHSLSRRSVLSALVIVSPLPLPAFARIAGSDGASIDAAFKAQAEETNARLRKSGFKLDTDEEQDAKLFNGLASYSYEDAQKSSKRR